MRYRTALRRGYEWLSTRPVSTNLAVEMCSVIRGIDTTVRRIPGTTIRNTATGDAVYAPPDGEAQLRGLLANWETFLHTHEHLDPLVRMAAGHYQFEAIHPFEDGNGRTGRILNLLFLIDQGLLLDVTSTDRWEPWLLYMLRVVEETSRNTTAKIRAMREQLRGATEFVQHQRNRRSR